MTTLAPSAADADNKLYVDSLIGDLAGWADPVGRLRTALEQDEFILYTQTIRVLDDPGARQFAEVLVRMQEEETSMLPPGAFLPGFEHYRMLPALDRWITSRLIGWLAAGGPAELGRGAEASPRFSINLARQTVGDALFPSFVAQQLARRNVPPHLLCFEVDDADASALPAQAASLASGLRSAGCRVLLDSFGRQNVSFESLRALRADYVKVDGSIVREVLRSPVALAKLRAIMRVGQVTGVGVIAECVEDREVLEVLVKLGVRYVQGFGISVPAPLAAR